MERKFINKISRKKKKGFTLIELVAVIAVMSLLALIIVPNLTKYNQKAELSKHINNVRQLENAMDIYVMESGDFPRLTDNAYTKAEIEGYSESIYDFTGEQVALDPSGNYYDIDYDKIKEYVSPPHESDKPKYILQNPVGKVFYMEKLSEEGEKRVDYKNKMQANIKTPNKPAVNNITENSAIIDGGSGTEVRIGEGAWHDSPHTFTNLNEDSNYVAYSRYKKTETHFASNISEGFNFRTDVRYEFTATFTNAGSTGRTGPSQSQLNNAYAGTALEGLVSSQNGIQLWTVPKTGKYRIETYGAQGGSSGGRGAIMQGEFSLKSEDKIKILVGQVGANAGYEEGSGGGGGSFVWRATSDTPLIVAGGGGGIFSGSQASLTISREANTKMEGNNGDGVGGTNGSGGGRPVNRANWGGGAGAGWLTDGDDPIKSPRSTDNYPGDTTRHGRGGHSILNGGGLGGTNINQGGFGGGGAGATSTGGAGGGGGYSGGGAGTTNTNLVIGNGGGGGSFNSGVNQANSVGNTGHGKVIITYIGE